MACKNCDFRHGHNGITKEVVCNFKQYHNPPCPNCGQPGTVKTLEGAYEKGEELAYVYECEKNVCMMRSPIFRKREKITDWIQMYRDLKDGKPVERIVEDDKEA